MKIESFVFFRKILVTILFIVFCFSLVAQLYYNDNRLFIGQKPSNWQNLSNNPTVLIGPSWGMEFFEDGINFRRIQGATNAGAYKIFIDGSGKIGIGMKPSTGTASLLQVNGSVWTPYGVLQVSDETIKRNILNLNDRSNRYLEKMLRLSGKSYEKRISTSEVNANEIDNFQYKKEFGFIAQEMQELFPELVEEGADGLLAIDYTGLVALLLESYKDLQKKIADLESRIERTN